jgi:hypothetical protein
VQHIPKIPDSVKHVRSRCRQSRHTAALKPEMQREEHVELAAAIALANVHRERLNNMK